MWRASTLEAKAVGKRSPEGADRAWPASSVAHPRGHAYRVPSYGMPLRRLLLTALLSCIAPAAAAQGVRGVVVTGDSVPVAGAVVTLLDSLGNVAVTVLSDDAGFFTLRAPGRGTWRLRTEAVGFARVTSFPFELAMAEVLQRRVQLTDATARLRSIDVREASRCDVRPAEGTQIALLWDEARKSLAVAEASVAGAPPVAFDYDEIEYDDTFLRVRSVSRTTTVGRAERGYRSDTPRALRELGYARRVDTTESYFAPDARVLLSDDFAATHCFTLVPDDPTSVRRIGIGFTPVGGRPGRLDVAGVLWLDRQTYALDRVEFRYDPLLSADMPDSTFGGRVSFARLPTGHVVVTRWVLRMPIFAAADDGRVARSGQTSQMLIRSERREVVAGVKLVRGMARAFDAPPEPLPVVNAAPRRAAGAPSCADAARPVPGTNGITGEVKDARGRAVGGARVRASWHQAFALGGRIALREQWVESGADAYGRYALCQLPIGSSIAVTARTPNAASGRSRMTLKAGPVAEAALVVAPVPRNAAPPSAPGAVHARLVGTEGRPVAGAEVRAFPGNERLRTDSAGEFRIASAEPGMREFFVRRVGYVPVMVQIEVAAGDTSIVTVNLQANGQVQQLAAVTVEARATSMNLAGFELRRESGIGGTFIGPEQIRPRENSTLENILRTFGRVRIEESAMTGDSRIYGRSQMSAADTTVKDRCSMQVIVDGALMGPNTPTSGLPPLREIAAVEIYQSVGSVPAMYNFSNPECGLLVIWTRDWSGNFAAARPLPRHPVHQVVGRELVGVVGEVDRIPPGAGPLHVVADVVVVVDDDHQPLPRVVVLVDAEELRGVGAALRVVHPLERPEVEERVEDRVADVERHEAALGQHLAHHGREVLPLPAEEVVDDQEAALLQPRPEALHL